MNRRLRKKKHRGEFAEFGAAVAVRLGDGADTNVFLDRFLAEAIEANDCLFGGGMIGPRLQGFIELGRRDGDPEARLAAIRGWLADQAAVREFAFGPVTDAWYGEFVDVPLPPP